MGRDEVLHTPPYSSLCFFFLSITGFRGGERETSAPGPFVYDYVKEGAKDLTGKLSTPFPVLLITSSPPEAGCNFHLADPFQAANQGRPKNNEIHHFFSLLRENLFVKNPNSDIRQVPDHQEIYLSRTGLTNIIVEINERIDKDHDENIHDDISAVKYHIRDICSDDDTFDESNFNPQPTALGKIPATSAYHGQVRIIPVKPQGSVADASASAGDAVASSSSRDGMGLEKNTTTCYYLLIRLEEKATDILVLVNVPHLELASNSAALEREKILASEVLGKMIQTLEVRDMSLFG